MSCPVCGYDADPDLACPVCGSVRAAGYAEPEAPSLFDDPEEAEGGE